MSSTTRKIVKRKASVKKAADKSSVTVKNQVKKVSSESNAPGKSTRTDKQKKVSVQEKELIVLGSVLLINDARKLYASLGKSLANNRNISIDGSSVEMIDTAMLQLLLAFVEKSRSQRKQSTWVKPSLELLKRAEALNLSDKLGLTGTDG